jgi:dynactin complex subunit
MSIELKEENEKLKIELKQKERTLGEKERDIHTFDQFKTQLEEKLSKYTVAF